MKTLYRLLTIVLPFCSISPKSIVADQASVLTPAASIEIPHSTGKFDFLRVDSKRHRLLAAHEKDETSDFIDLKMATRYLIPRAVRSRTSCS